VQLTRPQPLLANLLDAPTAAAFRALVATHRPVLSTCFLSHLAQAADAAALAGDAPAAARLEALGARLLPALEQADGATGTALLARLSGAAAQLGGDQPALTAPAAAEADAAQLGARWQALALRGEAGAGAQRGANAASRRDSAAALLGRVALAGHPALSPAAGPRVEARILAALLGEGDTAARALLLEEALTPPALGQRGDGEEELVSTTPVALLAAVEGALGRGEEPSAALRALRALLLARL